MIDTLPRSLSPELLEFCQTIGPADPTFVPSRPSTDARLSYCFDNVERCVEAQGGSTEYGWAIWHSPGLYFEAEHHGVWRTPDGAMVDVSPQLNNYDQILFLPDASSPYDPRSFRSNVIAGAPGSQRGATFATMAQRRYRILDRHRATGGQPIDLPLLSRIEIWALESQMRAIIDKSR